MVNPNAKVSSIQIGFGPKGLIAGLVIGFFVFLSSFIDSEGKDYWSRSLLILATLVYVAFAILFDRNKLLLTIIQFMIAAGLVVLAVYLDSKAIVALGLLGHALWDVWHLLAQQKYTPWWYAGACFYVDLGAAIYLFLV